MINGRVIQGREPTIPISLRRDAGQIVDVDAMIDTGFTDSIALPSQLIAELDLPFRETAHFWLADGTRASMTMHELQIRWFGEWRRVLAVSTSGAPMIGIGLLHKCHIEMDLIADGHVTIQQIG